MFSLSITALRGMMMRRRLHPFNLIENRPSLYAFSRVMREKTGVEITNERERVMKNKVNVL